ncbi:hypothetical protein GCM10010400_19660 [Streptomyces aculeolatus]|uniref:RNA-directed DNA polymerase n=1 Tax=Streptomyces aculeolatus TaxID=270689 RepID=UPI001CED00C5|nr:RNA-directed DNA polymerase [Streptomyces aculeolatus]
MLSRHTMNQLDFETALSQEIEWQPDLAPKQIVDDAVPADQVGEIAEYLKGVSLGESETPYADLLTAIKWRNGRRPIHILPLRERTLYRATVNYMKDELPGLDRSAEAYEGFEKGPLEDTTASYVIKTDIANYFSSIDHSLMRDEIIARTGRAEIARHLCEFWRAIFGRDVGIPQMSEPSKMISELLVDNLHRNLVRRGFKVWRYADDFRITAQSRHQAVTALDAVHEESRSMGLSLNDWKTHLLSIGKYKEFADEDERKEGEARSSAEQNLMLMNLYGDADSEPDLDEVLVETAEQLLHDWRDETPDAIIEHSSLLQQHRLIWAALTVLEAAGSTAGMVHLKEILLREPQLTPTVFRYTRSMGEQAAAYAGDTCVEILESGILNRWQQLWLSWALQDPEFAKCGVVRDQPVLHSFLTGLLSDRSEYVRSQAALCLAFNGMLDKADWASVDESTGALGVPYVAASLAGVQGIRDKERQMLRPGTKLGVICADWGAECIRSI